MHNGHNVAFGPGSVSSSTANVRKFNHYTSCVGRVISSPACLYTHCHIGTPDRSPNDEHSTSNYHAPSNSLEDLLLPKVFQLQLVGDDDDEGGHLVKLEIPTFGFAMQRQIFINDSSMSKHDVYFVLYMGY